jgi:adenylate kinase
MRIVLLGPQGAGKGTQAQRLSALTGAQHIATGDMVRAQIQAKTALGRAIKSYNDRGGFVPDELIVAMVQPVLKTARSWILDGFPRTVVQAHALDAALHEIGVTLDRVVILHAPDDELMVRLAGRRQSQATGRTYHLLTNPPPTDDPGPFIQRVDDTRAKIRRRLALYHVATEPLQEYYAARGLLAQVDACAPIASVTAAILRAVDDGCLSSPSTSAHAPVDAARHPLTEWVEDRPATWAVLERATQTE